MPAALTLQYRDRPDLWDQKGLVVNRVQEASRVLWDLAVLREIPEILGLRAFRVIRDLLDLKEIKGPLDPRVIQDL